jgi:CHAD domain-containing protein
VDLGGGDPLVPGIAGLDLPLPGAPLPEVLRLRAADSLADAVGKTLGAQGFKMWANSEGTLADVDPEFLHDLRVATRRAREALRLFAASVGEIEGRALRTELSWIAGLLGEVRDLDVFTASLQSDLRRTAAAPAVENEVLAALRELRVPHLDELRAALESERFRALVARLRGGALAVEAGSESAREGAGSLSRRQARRLVRLLEQTQDASEDAELHRIRIAFKKLRYTLEFFADLFEDDVNEVIRSLVAFQDCLGAHQDAVVGLGKLESLARDLAPRTGGRGGEAELLLAFGALMQLQRDRAARERGRFGRERKTLPALLRRLQRVVRPRTRS